MEPSFNLIDEPWIGAVDSEGQLEEYSLRDLLAQAHKLSGLHDDSPLVVAALLRMILALLHRIFDGPRNRSEWKAIWEAGEFDMAKIDGYFSEWRGRFDLFDKAHPFYQTSEAAADGQEKKVSTLLPELATGNNATLFDHTTDAAEIELSCAEAARVLVASQSFGLAGPCNPKLKLYFTDGTAARGIIFMCEGNSLFETLILNLLVYPSERPIPTSAEDCPVWETESAYQPEREIPNGYLDYLTWPNRRIRLLPEIIRNRTVVRRMELTPGLKTDATMFDSDPMKHYRIDEKRGHISMRFNENRAVWRDSAALLNLRATDKQVPAIFSWLGQLTDGVKPVLHESQTLRYMALGMASDQAKVEFFRYEHLPLPLAYLSDFTLIESLETILQTAESVSSELWKATGTMASVLLAPDEDSERRPDPDAVRNLRDSMGTERKYWAMLEPIFRQTVYALPQNRSDAKRQWFNWLRDTAWDSFNAASNGLGDDPRTLKATVRGQEQLARGLGKVLKTTSEIVAN